jgi:putative hydrolase of the HAD superfamily
MPHISAVLFDYGLVLTGPPAPAAWATMQQTLHAEDPAFHDAYWAHRNDYDKGVLTAQAYWRSVALDLTRPLAPTELAGLIEADIALWTVPNQPMIDWAAALQRAGVRTGILSNIGDAMESGIRARCTWLAAFTHHTFSHRLGTAKPDAAIYRHAAEGLATPPGEILFVDDRSENVAAAQDAGMKAIQYASQAQFAAALQAQGYGELLQLAPISQV